MKLIDPIINLIVDLIINIWLCGMDAARSCLADPLSSIYIGRLLFGPSTAATFLPAQCFSFFQKFRFLHIF